MVKRKGLGRLLKVKPACYAAEIVGGCSPDLSQEHPLSLKLRSGKTLQIIVSSQPAGASAWRQDFSRRIRMEQAYAPVLCVAHNGALSKADAEAGRLSAALREAGARSHTMIVRPYEVINVDGWLFGRWLCKFYCGYAKITGQDPHPDFIRYAFGMPTEQPVHFLFPVRVGAKPPLAARGESHATDLAWMPRTVVSGAWQWEREGEGARRRCGSPQAICRRAPVIPSTSG